MSSVERDPAGLLDRVPELGRLAEAHPALRKAIEHGRAHAAYRALFWVKLLGRAGEDAELIAQLLSTRRLFLQPLNGAPAMMTFNGFGARPYGNSEYDAQDGSHIITLYFVAIFVPVYPFSAYLVRPSGKGWTFFGKVPLSSAGYLWQRGLALLGLIAVLVGGFNALGAMRYNTVQIANALPIPVQVRVGSASAVTVLPLQVEKVRSKVGMQDIVVQHDGRMIERGQLEVKRGYDVNAWNVLGAGALYREDVRYTAKGSAPPSEMNNEPELFCGERSVLKDGIDYPFSTPPPNIDMAENEQVTHRSHFALAEFQPLFCVVKLEKSGKLSEAQTLAQHIVEATDYDFQIVDRLVDLFVARDDRKPALDLADAARKHHDDLIEYHRLYQGQAISSGQRTALVQEYRERARLQPASADAAYLLGRVLVGPEADHYVAESALRFPRHAYLLRSAAYRALGRGDFAEVERDVDALRAVDVAIWQDAVELELQALAGSGKIDKARELIGDCLKSPKLSPGNRFEAVVNAEFISHLQPKTSAEPVLQALTGDTEAETKELRLAARVNGCEAVTAPELETIEEKDLKSRLQLEFTLRSNPDAALSQVAAGTDASPGVTGVAWALLLTEAARLDEHHAALPRLVRWSPLGKAGALALVDYVRHGSVSEELDDVPPALLAAADFARSRSASGSEKQTLLARIAREDPLRGLVSVAMSQWTQ